MKKIILGDTEIKRRLDVLTKLYQINYDYQNQKEQRMWLFFSLFMTILLATIGWLLSETRLSRSPWKVLLLFTIMLLFTALAFYYIWNQNWLKAWSVERDYRMLAKLKQFDSDLKPTYHEIVDAAYPPKDDPVYDQKCRIFCTHGKSGVIILSIMSAVILFELATIFVYILKLSLFTWCWLFRGQ
jgi:hypothetical protein